MALRSRNGVFWFNARVGIYLCQSISSIHLSSTDVSFNRDNSIVYIKIKASKTDPFRSGTTVRLAAIRNHKLCPVSAMRAYLQFRSSQDGPLFLIMLLFLLVALFSRFCSWRFQVHKTSIRIVFASAVPPQPYLLVLRMLLFGSWGGGPATATIDIYVSRINLLLISTFWRLLRLRVPGILIVFR